MPRAASQTGPTGAGATHPDASDTDLIELRELGLDLISLALDVVGIFDPTPASDGASGLLALARGEWLDAAISGASMIPYIGDLAKAGKLPKYLKSLERAVELAQTSATAADKLLPGLRRLKEALDLLPAGVNAQLDRIRELVERFLRKEGAEAVAKRLPDVSGRFKFGGPTPVVHGGKKYDLRTAEGDLGVPGLVQRHPYTSSTQKKVAGGSGDDAGHLVGEQFGPPSGGPNLSRQNSIQNQGGGTWHEMEMRWAEKLQGGTGIRVRVKEYTLEGADRPHWRDVEWDEIAPDGSVSTHNAPSFLNTHTPDQPHRPGSRTQQEVKPTVDGSTSADVIDILTGKKR